MTSHAGTRFAALVLSFGLSAAAAASSDLYVYPAQGQNADQQGRDEYECYGFAKGQTGFDPMERPTATTAAPESSGASPVRGAAGTALLAGTASRIVTGSSKDAKKAAGAGAAVGALIGGARRRNEQREQQAWAEQQAANYEGRRNEYNRAYAACLEGRGYTVR